MGVVPHGKEGVVKQEEFLCTEQLLHRGPQRGVAESGKARQSWNLEGKKNRESCTPQSINSSQTMALTKWQAQGTNRSPQKSRGAEGGPGCQVRHGIQISAAHITLVVQREGPGR